MHTRLVQIGERVKKLDKLADEVATLVKRQFDIDQAQPELSQKGEMWYRGARELLARYEFSGLNDFEECYAGRSYMRGMHSVIHETRAEIARFSDVYEVRQDFDRQFREARGLVNSLVAEIESRELLAASQLSLVLSADEFDTAQHLFETARNDEAFLRASGVVARVALERHLFTVADSRQIQIQVNPPMKKKPEVEDVLTTFVRQNVITAIQKSELDSLLKVANNCAHPKEAVNAADVERLIKRGKELAAIIS